MSDVTHDPKENAQNSRADREFQKKFFALGRCCYYCGQPLALCRAHREHKTPKCRGGSNEISNIVPSCDRCNQMKAWRTEAEFLKDQPRLFAHDAQTIRGIDKPKPSSVPYPSRNLELINNQHLLEHLRQEEERVSWAWRNPS